MILFYEVCVIDEFYDTLSVVYTLYDTFSNYICRSDCDKVWQKRQFHAVRHNDGDG